MEILIFITISTTLVSLISFFGVLVLLFKEEIIDKILIYLVSFSAGTLMAGAFLHLIPESITELGGRGNDLSRIFLFVLLGFSVFFVLEHFIKWHHHHAREHPEIMPFSYLILVGDAIHNLIDGLIIAGSFVVSVSLGVMTSLLVAFHEIPQEIGDFGILIFGGFKRKKALLLNFLSGITAILGGIMGFFLSEKIGNSFVFLLPFSAGGFIYIAASDLIPEMKYKENKKKSFLNFVVFLAGIALIFFLGLFFEA